MQGSTLLYMMQHGAVFCYTVLMLQYLVSHSATWSYVVTVLNGAACGYMYGATLLYMFPTILEGITVVFEMSYDGNRRYMLQQSPMIQEVDKCEKYRMCEIVTLQ